MQGELPEVFLEQIRFGRYRQRLRRHDGALHGRIVCRVAARFPQGGAQNLPSRQQHDLEAGLGVALHVRRHNDPALDLGLDADPPIVDQLLLRGARRCFRTTLGLLGFVLLARGFLLLALAFHGSGALFAFFFTFRVVDALLLFRALLLLDATRFVFAAQFFLLRALLLRFLEPLFLSGLALLLFQPALLKFRFFLLLSALCHGLFLRFVPLGLFLLLLAQFLLELDIRDRRLRRFHLRRGRLRGRPLPDLRHPLLRPLL